MKQKERDIHSQIIIIQQSNKKRVYFRLARIIRHTQKRFFLTFCSFFVLRTFFFLILFLTHSFYTQSKDNQIELLSQCFSLLAHKTHQNHWLLILIILFLWFYSRWFENCHFSLVFFFLKYQNRFFIASTEFW